MMHFSPKLLQAWFKELFLIVNEHILSLKLKSKQDVYSELHLQCSIYSIKLYYIVRINIQWHVDTFPAKLGMSVLD